MSQVTICDQARARWNSLTKPPGSLGMLEHWVVRYCGITGEVMPPLPRKGMYVFCANHGVTAEGVSAYPSEVTRLMVDNFACGGAAINVLCRQGEIETEFIDAGIDPGTANMTRESAMPRAKAEELLKRGRILAHSARARFDLVGVGEMGIGNTTASAALLSVFSGRAPRETAGYGAGLDDAGLERKIHAMERALALHSPDAADPVGTLASVGGFEIAMMAGFLLGAHQARLPVVLDGFISGAAALVAHAMEPDVLDTAFFSHRSAEHGHELMLLLLEQRAPLDLGMRLGEGTGAAIQMQLIEMAIRLYRDMATFEEAGIE